MVQASQDTATAPHIPVLLSPILDAIAPVSGRWLDGTFGAGGYTRALLDAGADTVYAIDRDPETFERAASWAGEYGDRLRLIAGEFGNLDTLADENDGLPLNGVVLDIGVSSMQIDQAERGFSFMQDGPLDMRMSQSGMTAADIVNTADEATLADMLYLYGEERASRRIARNIVKARTETAFQTTAELARVIENSLPRAKPNQAHPATRSFQALRIAVNDELGQLVDGLIAAETALGEGGILAVVTFHSLEDRIVKRFLQARSAEMPRGSRYQPEEVQDAPRFERIGRKAISARDDEIDANPRARSAKLRLARRLSAPAGGIEGRKLGLPNFDLERLR
ncbi:ribosomal RNA small subunit methyltransferase H [Amylibacter ulvae]|uniref:Ribosomal RNA small subunit methyltransferase H n=1 Tax=Paramylibacter ulvae TaxID=1651968 RepID=A0ABQ3D2I8_9RHOB|nr:16S rRNA (cytosine(1402)-N(4))-methyltransferase RsmH [Amylibacter ulvae]GHA52689.1 ribosomal RNA small subunit methyltransferase H [Amylibacter ulvae]